MTLCHSEVQTDVYRRSNWATNLPGMSCYWRECLVKKTFVSSIYFSECIQAWLCQLTANAVVKSDFTTNRNECIHNLLWFICQHLKVNLHWSKENAKANCFPLIFVAAQYEQECIPVGCVPSACCQYLPACTAPGGSVCSWWGLLRGSLLGGSAPRGCLLWGDWYPSMHWGRPLPVNRITDRCKNIALPQLHCGR